LLLNNIYDWFLFTIKIKIIELAKKVLNSGLHWLNVNWKILSRGRNY
jgi:hypothetical protein